MKTSPSVLLVYHHFRTPGGDAAVFRAEADLLRRNGWDVTTVEDSTPGALDRRQRIALGLGAIWSRRWHRRIRDEMTRTRPDVVHVHNTFPAMSPSVLFAARDAGATVVSTLHDYRVVCPSALCFRAGAPCEDCVGRSFAWPGLVHGCYRDSRVETVAPVGMLAAHRALGTWSAKVDLFLAPSRAQRDVLVRGRIPADRIHIVTNLVDPDPGERPTDGAHCLFVGNLSEHKGITTLLAAWSQLDGVPLKVVGGSPSARDRSRLGVLEAAGVEFLGPLPHDDVFEVMRGARLLVFPSRWYEVTPVTIIEALACGLPIVAARLGSLPELVQDGRTGLLFSPDDPRDLAAKVRWAWAHRQEMAAMGRNARAEYERHHTGPVHYARLCEAYEIASVRRRAELRTSGARP